MAVWNNGFEATPAGSEDPSLGDDRFRELKLAVRERLQKEHTMNLSSGIAGEDGWHKGGTAKVYLQSTAPDLRPDGLTALNAEDNGRIWIDTNSFRIRVYKHDAGATTAERWVLQNDLIPVGEVLLWPGENATIPTGWMRCAGTAISRADYSVLHAIMKDVGGTGAYGWGSGDGSTTFNLPNLANPMPRGAGYIIKVRSVDPNATVESAALDARVSDLEAYASGPNFIEYLGATNTTWVAPPNTTEVVLSGVGQGGNGAAGTANTNGGGGGGSGAWCRNLRKAVVPGQSYNIVLSTSGNSTFFGVTLGRGGNGSGSTGGAGGTGSGGASNGGGGGPGQTVSIWFGGGGGGVGGTALGVTGSGGGTPGLASAPGIGGLYPFTGDGGPSSTSPDANTRTGGIGAGGTASNGVAGGPSLCGGGGAGGSGNGSSFAGGAGGPPFLRIDW